MGRTLLSLSSHQTGIIAFNSLYRGHRGVINVHCKYCIYSRRGVNTRCNKFRCFFFFFLSQKPVPVVRTKKSPIHRRVSFFLSFETCKRFCFPWSRPSCCAAAVAAAVLSPRPPTNCRHRSLPSRSQQSTRRWTFWPTPKRTTAVKGSCPSSRTSC